MTETLPVLNSALAEDDYLTQGVLSRRFAAWWVDIVLIGGLMAVLYLGTVTFGVLTLGLGFYLLPWISLVPFTYHWLTMASPLSATPGQALVGLVVRRNNDLGRPSLVEAAIFVVLYYITLAVFCPALLLGLFTVRKRNLHDIASGLVVIRKRALTPPSAYWNMRQG